jgi:16S rRNA (uracil1498-N3)-methyltransferase
MHRFYASPEQCAGDSIELDGPEAHHALHVLRSRVGDVVTVLNGVGGVLVCRVAALLGRRIELKIVERRELSPPACEITLYQAVPKGKVMDGIIHKATELGVRRIVPIISEHVISRPGAGDGARKVEKWQVAAIEAIKQCGQAWLPAVEAPRGMAEVLKGRQVPELEFIGALCEWSKHPKRCFLDFEAENLRKPASVGVWIGPEGDFTRDEVDMVVGAGACPVTLGPLVLKCETAATYMLSVVNYEVQAGLA